MNNSKILSVFLMAAATLGLGMLITSQAYASIRSSEEVDMDVYGTWTRADAFKEPQNWPQSERDGRDYITCHPLAPCFVKSFEDMATILKSYPLAVVGVDPYHLYDATDAQQTANEKKWLTSLGLENIDVIIEREADE